jgi:hypothetical protein
MMVWNGAAETIYKILNWSRINPRQKLKYNNNHNNN